MRSKSPLLVGLILGIFCWSRTVSAFSMTPRTSYPRRSNIQRRSGLSENVGLPLLAPFSVVGEGDQPIPSSGSSLKVTTETVVLLALCFCVTTLCSLDKVAMSVAIIPMSQQFLYSETTKGAIASIFSVGYLVGLLPAGVLGTMSSPKTVLSIGVLLWSVAQLSSAPSAYIGLDALLFARFFMGLAEATTIPILQVLVANWVPRDRRSFILGVIFSGLQFGNVLAYFLSPTLLDSFGWEGLFNIYGLLGLLWLGAWIPLARDNPSELPEAAAEVAEDDSLRPPVPWRKIVSSREIQAISVAHCVQNFGMYIILAWLPTYYNLHFSLNAGDSSFNSVGPWVAGALCSLFAGRAADALIDRGVSRTVVRRAMQSFALLVPASAMLSLALLPDLSAAQTEACFVLSCSAAAANVAGYGSSVQDVCGSSKHLSAVYSVSSAPAVVCGSLGVYLTGRLLDSLHDWTLVFEAIAAVYVIGAAYYCKYYSAIKVIE